MAVRSLDWVPSGAWLAPGYAEWAPPAPLRDVVACLWAAVAPEGADRSALVLPDACSDLIWEQGAGGYLAGPDTGPAHSVTTAGTVLIGVRFRPSATRSLDIAGRLVAEATPDPAVTRAAALLRDPAARAEAVAAAALSGFAPAALARVRRPAPGGLI